MFTGIIEATGLLTKIKKEDGNISFLIESKISAELAPDQSVSHDGVCLTVTENNHIGHWVTAVAETLQKTNLSSWSIGRVINLERALRIGDRLDGHIVQGHVDTTAQCIEKEETNGSHVFQFQISESFASLLIEKGSVAINGVSLTAFGVGMDHFMVAVIPYTFEHTSFLHLGKGATINIEFDILGKYLLRQQEVNKPGAR
jgi:riboflavin synthase